MDKERKLALLIDAENIASKYISIILNEANNLGNVIYKRIYGNWTSSNMSAWKSVILDNCIQPIQQYSNVSGKNSSDSSLIIDAMDLLYMGRLDGFCIVSSDSDFTRLASRLRESEMFVLGMGEQKTPQSFISACNKFSYLDLLYAAGTAETPAAGEGRSKKPRHKKAAAPEEERPGSSLEAVCQALRELAEENSDDEGWIFSSQLRDLLVKKFPDFDVRNFQHKKFVPFIESLGIFEAKKLSPKENDTAKTVYFRLK